MKALKFLGIGLGALLVLIIVVTSMQSPKSHLERSVVINAQPASIFAYVNNLKNFNEWSPWHNLDPNTKYDFEGPEAGVGAKMSWKSDHEEVGEGVQWIVESEENKRVKTGMQFGGFEGDYFAEVVLEPTENNATKVTWHYYGDVSNASTFGAAAGKFFGMFMDGMLGPSYEKGLASLKQVVERKASQPGPVTEPTPADTTQVQ